jgi:hypothetical protein
MLNFILCTKDDCTYYIRLKKAPAGMMAAAGAVMAMAAIATEGDREPGRRKSRAKVPL